MTVVINDRLSESEEIYNNTWSDRIINITVALFIEKVERISNSNTETVQGAIVVSVIKKEIRSVCYGTGKTIITNSIGFFNSSRCIGYRKRNYINLKETKDATIKIMSFFIFEFWELVKQIVIFRTFVLFG